MWQTDFGSPIPATMCRFATKSHLTFLLLHRPHTNDRDPGATAGATTTGPEVPPLELSIKTWRES